MGQVQWSLAQFWQIWFMFHSLLTADQAPPQTGWILSKLGTQIPHSSSQSSQVQWKLKMFLNNQQEHPENILSCVLLFEKKNKKITFCPAAAKLVLRTTSLGLQSACHTNGLVKSKVCCTQTECSKVRHNQQHCVCSQQTAQWPWQHEKAGPPPHIKPSFGGQGVALLKWSHGKLCVWV